MNRLQAHPSFSSTSAAGAMLVPHLHEPVIVLVGVMLEGLGTSTERAFPVEMISRAAGPAQQTTSGMPVVPAERTGIAIAELRRLSGLTWDQVARLFNVSRRSLHFWASGKAMTPANEEHLHRLLAVLRKIDRGSASTNRTALLGVHGAGVIPFDVLANGHYDDVVTILGQGQSVARALSSPLSDDARLAHVPRPPQELVGALHDRVHRETGAVRAAKSVRNRSVR